MEAAMVKSCQAWKFPVRMESEWSAHQVLPPHFAAGGTPPSSLVCRPLSVAPLGQAGKVIYWYLERQRPGRELRWETG